MENKENHTLAPSKTFPLSNGLPRRGSKSITSKESSPTKTVGENTKAVNHVNSNRANKNARSESVVGGGATPSNRAQQVVEHSLVNKTKSTTNPSGAPSKRTGTKLQKPASTKQSHSRPVNQTDAPASAKTGSGKVREFNVTHLSDNWKRRKAEKLAAIEREKAKFAAALQKASSKKDAVETAEITQIVDNQQEQKPAMRELDILEEEEDIDNVSKNPSAKDILFPMKGLKGDTASKLEQLELLLKENKLDGSEIIQVNGFVDFGDSNDDKKPKTNDFDIDKSPPESESEDPEVSPRSKNKTLLAYMTACAKSGLKPNPTFMRQCGQSSIDMRNRMLTHRDARPMAIALVGDRRTSLLDLSDNPLGPQGTTCIAEMMYANESIMELNLNNTDVGTEGLQALSQTLPNNKSLRRLHLDNNKLQEGDGRHLAKLVTTVPDLRELNLNQTALGFKDGTRLAIALASDAGNLNTLSLQYNNIRTESAVQLALSLGKNTTLKSLNLAWNGFGADGCRALAKALGENSTLTELDLTNNRLGITSLEHIVAGLKKNSSLKSVKFGTNPMTTEGAKALITALEQSKDTSIEEIDLRGIPIDQDFMDMATKLQETKGITVLHDTNVQMGTSTTTKKFDGDNLDRFDPVMVLFEYMKKDNLRVIDLFQFLDQKKRDKLSRKDIRDGVNILRLPFTEHALDQIMKALDRNKDGFIQLDDMMKGYKENESVVKQRRIKANRRGKPDRGLEDLWEILKELIAKRKADNEKKSQEAQAQAQQRKSLTQAQIQAQLQTARKSLIPGQLQEQLNTPRKSLTPSQLQAQLKTPRKSLIPAQLQGPLQTPRKSLIPAQLKTPRKSIAPTQ